MFWPTWEWISAPWLRWIYASYAQNLSTRDSLKCRRIIESNWYQERWGAIYQLTSDQNVKNRFENNRTGLRLATSVGGIATGEGGDRLVCDDPHNVLEAESDAIRKNTLQWWDEVMSTRLNDPKTGARLLIMQRSHYDDLAGHVLEQGGYEHLCLPAEYEKPKGGTKYTTGIGWSDPRNEEGELLSPERFGPNEIAELKRRLGSYAASAQLQQLPVPRGGGIFKRDDFKFYTRETLPTEFDEVLQSWDCSFKKTDTADFVAGHVWARKGAQAFLLDREHERKSFTETITAVRRMSSNWPQAIAKLVEDKANGPAIIDYLTKEIPGLIPVDPQGGKEARAFACQPIVEAGNVWLPHPDIAPWVTELLDQLCKFPKVTHDDDVDAMTQALMRMMVRMGFGIIDYYSQQYDAMMAAKKSAAEKHSGSP